MVLCTEVGSCTRTGRWREACRHRHSHTAPVPHRYLEREELGKEGGGEAEGGRWRDREGGKEGEDEGRESGGRKWRVICC